MKIENLEKLQEALYRKGFGKELNAELEKQMESGKPEFILEHFTKIDNDEVGYRLHFRRDDDPEKDKVYLNSYDAAILKNADAPGEIREHNFQADKLITAMEAYRMLKHGDLVAVNKTLFNKEGEKYNTWLSIDVKGQKDEYGNYPVSSYHENYYRKQPFIIRDELEKLPVPVKELENKLKFGDFEKALMKANLVHVTIMLGGKQQPGILAVNAKVGKIDVYDAKMQLVEQQSEAPQQSLKENGKPEEAQAEEKKKSWENRQQVKWDRPKNQHKGHSL